MAGEPAENSAPDPAAVEGGSADPPTQAPEREGPVAIERLEKADGRALILYTRVQAR